MRGGRQRLRLVLLAAVGLGFAGTGILAHATDALERLELDTVDLRFDVRGEQPVPNDVVVVAIDDRTLSQLRRRFPFPRSLHATAVDRLRRAGARGIAYDVQFSEPSSPGEDRALAEAIGRVAPRLVLGTTEVAPGGTPNLLPELVEAGARAGNANFPTDVDGVIRRVPASVDGLVGFAARAANLERRIVARSPFGEDGAWIDFAGQQRVRTVSFSELVRGRAPASAFSGRIVVVGASAPSLQDVHATAAGGGLMPGAEIQAHAISTILHDFPLRSASGLLDLLLIVLLALAAPAAAWRLSLGRALVVWLGLAASYLVAAQLAFNAGTILALTHPMATLALSAVGSLAVNYFTEIRDRQRMRVAFARFVPEQVVDQVLEQAEDDLRLGGVEREGTVMFCDLRGFTAFAETLPAERVIEVLNRYLTEMSEAILDHGGTLVSYQGDGIMAVFGAPIAQSDHADRALATAREMLGERLERFNRWAGEAGPAGGFRMGIGLNSGSFMSGNVGSERRLEYAAIGDTTNTAARLEAMTKRTPHQVLVAESTRSLLGAEAADLVFVDEVEVRGRQAPIRVWTLPNQA